MEKLNDSLTNYEERVLEGGKWLNNSSYARQVDPEPSTNMVIHPSAQEEWEWRVSDLIDWRIHWWDRDLIESNFHWTNAEAILRIPLSRRHVCD